MIIGDRSFLGASDLPDVAVELQDFCRACFPVKAVYVLGDERKGRKKFLPGSQDMVAGIGCFLGDDSPAPIIKFPDKLWILGKGAGSGQLFRPVLFPQSFLAAEGGDAGFSRDASACGGSDAFRLEEDFDQRSDILFLGHFLSFRSLG